MDHGTHSEITTLTEDLSKEMAELSQLPKRAGENPDATVVEGQATDVHPES